MAKKTVLLIGTLDTKGPEIDYIRRIINRMGLKVLVMDVGLLRPPTIRPDITRYVISEAGGVKFDDMHNLERRDLMLNVMGVGAGVIAQQLYHEGKIHGVAAVGGNQGTFIATNAMRQLPIGLPKVMVSTVASGNTRPYIGISDTAMIFSVADLLGGPNAVTRTVLTSAAGAIAGMCLTVEPKESTPTRTIVGVTAFGNIEPAVSRARKRLRNLGYEVVIFHASGAGGSAMERLVEDGIISAVLDMVTHEVLGDLFPEDLYAPVTSGRLLPVVKKKIPYVFVPGGLDYFVFGGTSTIPKRYRKRRIHYHNPNNTNIRTNPGELRKVGRAVAERLSLGPERVHVVIPMRGWTEFGKRGGPLHDPEADIAFVSSLRRHAVPELHIQEVNMHINNPRFADLCVNLLHDLLRSFTSNSLK